MTSRLHPYLGFADNARQAMECYPFGIRWMVNISQSAG